MADTELRLVRAYWALPFLYFFELLFQIEPFSIHQMF